jgi:hypothetical protein
VRALRAFVSRETCAQIGRPKAADAVATVWCFLLGTPVGNWGGVMYWRGAVLSLAAVSLLGCASERTGADYAAMTQKVGPPRAGQARIVVLREKGFSGIGDPG